MLTIIEAIDDGITLSDKEGYFEIYNLKMCEITGYSREEANSNKYFLSLLYPDPEKLKEACKGIEEIFKKGKAYNVETMMQAKDGTRKTLLVSTSLIRYNDRDMLLSVYRDITERKKTEEALSMAYAELRTAQFQLIQNEKLEAIASIAACVAHEVANPLATIIQCVNYLEEKFPARKKDIAEILKMMKNNVKRADNIVRALSDLSKAQELKLGPEIINSVIEESLTLIQPSIKRQDIEIIKELGVSLPKVLIDKGRIEQAFINILLNAVQAMPHGGKIFIRSHSAKLTETRSRIGRRISDYFKLGEETVIVEIKDTGIGISEENLKKIFEPFFTTKRRSEGSGLGLSITRGIIDMHKGVIEVNSEEGKGTTVIIYLKVVGGK